MFRGSVAFVYAIVVSLLLHFGLFLWPLVLFNKWRKIAKPLYPLELLERIWAWGLLSVLGTKLIVEGAENVVSDPTIIMFSHGSNLDAMALFTASPVKPKFIFKRSLLYTMPFVVPLFYFFGHIPINRSNRESAIGSLEDAGREIVEQRVSIAVSPEGTRSTTGLLQPFKKGPFHLAKSVGAPITPALISNNFNLWPPKQPFPLSGVVRVRFLPQIPVTSEDTVDGLIAKVHQVMEDEFNCMPKHEPDIGEQNTSAIVFLLLCCSAIFLIFLCV